MIEFFDTSEYWHWCIAAAVFIILEIFAPGVIFIWMGIASAVVAAFLFVLPDLSWEYQVSIWGIFAVLSAVLGKRYLVNNPLETDEPHLNQRGGQYVGRVFTLDTDIENGIGKIKVDDTTWKVVCDQDLKKGAKVKVVDLEGVTLKVEPHTIT